MFPSRYFASRYFAPRYWPRTSAEEVVVEQAGPGVPVFLKPRKKPDDKEDELIVLEMI